MSLTEIAWAAGFFDGEGYVGVRNNGNKKYPNKYWYMMINISQNDIEVLERFKSAVGFGKIYGPKTYKDKSLPMYNYIVSKQADVITVMEKLLPFLSSKKKHQYERCRNNARENAVNYNKLTEEMVRDIRKRYSDGQISMRALASEYNCDTGSISRIVNNKAWKNVK